MGLENYLRYLLQLYKHLEQSYELDTHGVAVWVAGGVVIRHHLLTKYLCHEGAGVQRTNISGSLLSFLLSFNL